MKNKIKYEENMEVGLDVVDVGVDVEVDARVDLKGRDERARSVVAEQRPNIPRQLHNDQPATSSSFPRPPLYQRSRRASAAVGEKKT
jgi:hypothetical protein